MFMQTERILMSSESGSILICTLEWQAALLF